MLLIQDIRKTLLISAIFLGSYTNLCSQTNWPFVAKSVPYISEEDYEPPLYEMAKRLWLPDSIIVKENNTILKQCCDIKSLKSILSDTSSSNENKRRECFQRLSYFDDPVVHKIFSRALIHDSDNIVKSICIRKLGKKSTSEGVAALVEAIKLTYDIRQKIDLAKSLITVGQYNDGFQLIKSLYNLVSPVTQIDFLYYIRKIPGSKTRVFLIETQKNSNPYIAASTSLILAQLNEKDGAFTKLSELVEDSDKYVRIIAMKGLTYIGDKKSINLIKQKTNDKDSKVKNIAKAIINELNQ